MDPKPNCTLAFLSGKVVDMYVPQPPTGGPAHTIHIYDSIPSEKLREAARLAAERFGHLERPQADDKILECVRELFPEHTHEFRLHELMDWSGEHHYYAESSPEPEQGGEQA